MQIVTVGLDCNEAPVEIRERISFTPHRLAAAYQALLALPSVQEAAILSTCNRVELYVYGGDDLSGTLYATLKDFLGDFHHTPTEIFESYLFFLSGPEAVRHLFEVASGIQSMVVGEAQIQGQVREAIEHARRLGASGRVLDAFFRAAITTGKRARTETAIGENGVSVSFTAIELLEEKIGSLEGKHALVIGSGKTGRLTGQILLDKKVSDLTLVNRDLGNACETARQLGLTEENIRAFEALVPALSEADVVITSTAAPHPVVLRAHLETAMAARGEDRPIYIVDIAVPRDVEPDAAQVPGVRVWDIDGVNVLAEANKARRSGEVGHVREIVAEELADFMAWLGALTVVPTITTLRQHADTIRKNELHRTIQALGDVSDREVRLLEDLTSRIVNKLLHEPTLRLKEVANSTEADRYAEVVRHLFSLNGVNSVNGTH
ncbi:MAG: glutamyl-tRNA reductase [Chloroflexi bacterium]|nr:glutamyl-tRNA reductase [Chloroflexota bacterium]OJV89170.1 MAG: glutamyl-tRNA reductase [Chloroflexi bacterium 54-19]